MKRALGPLERIFPMPCALVAAGPMEDPGICTVAWINVVASTPPTIAIGLREIRNTLRHIENTGSFTVNIPSAEMVDVVDYFGIATGNKDGVNKLEVSGLHVSPASMVAAPLIDECPYNLECVVSQTIEVGAYTILLAEIMESHASESILIDADSDVVSMDALNPLVYIPGAREYRTVGPKVADAYSAGKGLV